MQKWKLWTLEIHHNMGLDSWIYHVFFDGIDELMSRILDLWKSLKRFFFKEVGLLPFCIYGRFCRLSFR
jgi:hypothetical protein